MTHWAHAWVDHLAYSGWLIKDPCHYPLFSTTPCSPLPHVLHVPTFSYFHVLSLPPHHLLFSCPLTSSSPSPIFMSSHFLLTISYFHVLSLPPHHLLLSCPLTSSSPSPIFMSSHFLLTISYFHVMSSHFLLTISYLSFWHAFYRVFSYTK